MGNVPAVKSRWQNDVVSIIEAEVARVQAIRPLALSRKEEWYGITLTYTHSEIARLTIYAEWLDRWVSISFHSVMKPGDDPSKSQGFTLWQLMRARGLP